MAVGEEGFVGHHTFQYGSYWIGCARNFNFHNQKYDGQDVKPTENQYHQVAGQAN